MSLFYRLQRLVPVVHHQQRLLLRVLEHRPFEKRPLSSGRPFSEPIEGVLRPNFSTAFSSIRRFSSSNDSADYETISHETLESLGDYLEVLLEADPRMTESDVNLANGVLTISIPTHGTYVINKQSPNRQLWLSSPISGPARFDLVENRGWVYKHTDESLHSLLNREIGQSILGLRDPGFEKCFFGTGQADD